MWVVVAPLLAGGAPSGWRFSLYAATGEEAVRVSSLPSSIGPDRAGRFGGAVLGRDRAHTRSGGVRADASKRLCARGGARPLPAGRDGDVGSDPRRRSAAAPARSSGAVRVHGRLYVGHDRDRGLARNHVRARLPALCGTLGPSALTDQRLAATIMWAGGLPALAIPVLSPDHGFRPRAACPPPGSFALAWIGCAAGRARLERDHGDRDIVARVDAAHERDRAPFERTLDDRSELFLEGVLKKHPLVAQPRHARPSPRGCARRPSCCPRARPPACPARRTALVLSSGRARTRPCKAARPRLRSGGARSRSRAPSPAVSTPGDDADNRPADPPGNPNDLVGGRLKIGPVTPARDRLHPITG